jgi:hypothetical protein
MTIENENVGSVNETTESTATESASSEESHTHVPYSEGDKGGEGKGEPKKESAAKDSGVPKKVSSMADLKKVAEAGGLGKETKKAATSKTETTSSTSAGDGGEVTRLLHSQIIRTSFRHMGELSCTILPDHNDRQPVSWQLRHLPL